LATKEPYKISLQDRAVLAIECQGQHKVRRSLRKVSNILPLLLTKFGIFGQIFRSFRISNFIKIRPVESELIHAVRKRKGHKFRSNTSHI